MLTDDQRWERGDYYCRNCKSFFEQTENDESDKCPNCGLTHYKEEN